MFNDKPYANAVLGYTERRPRQRSTMPPTTTCDNCGLTYYQTSAAHVCAGGVRGAKENPMTTLNDYECSECKSTSPLHARGCSATEPSIKHEPAARGEGERWRLEYYNRSPSEPWLFCVTLPSGAIIARTINEYDAKRIIDEHNSHTALVEQWERALKLWADLQRGNEELQRWAGERMESLAKSLAAVVGERNEAREAASLALTQLRAMRDRHQEWWDYNVTPEMCIAWDKLKAVVDSSEHEQEGGPR